MADSRREETIFKDFIPDGEDTGAFGEGGFRDFVPPPEPKPQVVEEEKPKPNKNTKKKK